MKLTNKRNTNNFRNVSKKIKKSNYLLDQHFPVGPGMWVKHSVTAQPQTITFDYNILKMRPL